MQTDYRIMVEKGAENLDFRRPPKKQKTKKQTNHFKGKKRK